VFPSWSRALPRVLRSARLVLASLICSAVVLTGVAAPAQAREVTAPTTAHPLLRYGDTGHTVAYLQYRLRVQPRTGYFGRLTEQAVKNLQRRYGLSVTGAVPNSVWTVLRVPYRPPAGTPPLRPGTWQFGSRAMGLAVLQTGKPYEYGGDGPDSFDCSGLVTYVFRQMGYRLPRVSYQIRAALPRLSSRSVTIGDLVFVDNGPGGRVGHVAIYAGDGYWFEASNPSRPVGKHEAWSTDISYGRVR
jgi:peptidoglycan DL-endopeptidase CwlO